MYLGNVIFDSRAEAAVACCLVEFLGIELCTGDTCNINIGHRKIADFYLPEQNIILEYHPIRIEWEWKNREAYKLFSKALRGIPAKKKRELLEATRAALRTEYEVKRQFFMDQSDRDDIRQARLVVCSDAQELYYKIINPYGTRAPKRETFKRKFSRIARDPAGYYKGCLKRLSE